MLTAFSKFYIKPTVIVTFNKLMKPIVTMNKTAATLIFFLLLPHVLKGQIDKATIHLNDSIQIDLYRTKFDTSGKQLEFNDKYLIAINGRPLFGTDGDLPYNQLTKAKLTIGKNKFKLQVDDMYNPWVGEIPNRLFSYKIFGKEIRIRAILSDGAGTYGAEWLIVGHACIRTILSDDESIIIGIFQKTNN